MPHFSWGRTIRCFTGFEFGLDVVNGLFELQRRIYQRVDRLREKVVWIPATSFHSTLTYLGELDPVLLEAVEAELQPALHDLPPFCATVRDIDLVSINRGATFLWAHVHVDEEMLAQLYRTVDAKLELLGFSSLSHEDRPHLTLAYFNGVVPKGLSQSLEELKGAAIGTSVVEALNVFTADWTRGGHRYEVLRRLRIGQSHTGKPIPAPAEAPAAAAAAPGEVREEPAIRAEDAAPRDAVEPARSPQQRSKARPPRSSDSRRKPSEGGGQRSRRWHGERPPRKKRRDGPRRQTEQPNEGDKKQGPNNTRGDTT